MKIKSDITAKPYYRCFICPRFRNTCGGRPTRDMDLKEWCEYIRDIRDYFGLTNAYLTEKAESSAKTTERIMAGVERLCDIARDVVIVTNEVFGDGVDYPELTEQYLAVLADINRRISAKADSVYEVVCGIPVQWKGDKK